MPLHISCGKECVSVYTRFQRWGWCPNQNQKTKRKSSTLQRDRCEKAKVRRKKKTKRNERDKKN